MRKTLLSVFHISTTALFFTVLSACSPKGKTPNIKESLTKYKHEAPEPVKTEVSFKRQLLNCSFKESNSKFFEQTGNNSSACISNKFALKPGNYEFSALFKAQGLGLSTQTALTDVLSIRLKIFDKNNQEISTSTNFLGQVIDAGELNYTLNRVNNDGLIDGLGLFPIHLVPRYYPFDSGWLPQNVSFAQIVIELNGAYRKETAQVEIKELDINYSKWNHQLKDRIDYTNHGSNLAEEIVDSILPQPQVITTTGKVFSFSGDQSNLKINSSLNEEVGHDEGYKLDVRQNIDGKPVVDVVGNDHRGLAYGLETLKQIIKIQDGTSYIPEISIVDYPAFKVRAVRIPEDERHFAGQEKISTWFLENRLNTVFIDAQLLNQGWNQDPSYALNLAKILDQRAKDGEMFEFGMMLNPYLFSPTEQDDKFIFSSETIHNQFLSFINQYEEIGAKHLLLRFDDFPPRIPGKKFGFILADEDKVKFKSLADAHMYFLDSIRDSASEEMQIYFTPTWYNPLFADLSDGLGDSYLKEIGNRLDKEIPIVWTGPTVRSLFIDQIHEKRFKDKLGTDSKLIWWDNTLYAREHKQLWGEKKGRIRLKSHIEPFDVSVDPEIFNRDASENIFYANSYVDEFYRIKLATLGAFLWNPKKYVPEKALLHYLDRRFGRDTAKLILDLDSYLNLYQDNPSFVLKVKIDQLLKKIDGGITQDLYKEFFGVWNKIRV